MVQKLKNFYHLLVAAFFNLFYRFPSRKLKVIGVTGTDGKTTTVTLIAHILRTAGYKTALISSIGARIGEEELKTGLHTTTPDPKELQRLIRLAVDKKTEYLVLESTSHGLDQHRLFGIKFLVGVMTNVTHEHLDYHRTFQRYLVAKSKLFRGVKIAILNGDDDSFGYLKTVVPGRAKIVSYGIKRKADFTLKSFEFKTSLPGEYNRYNCLAAIAATATLGVPEVKIRQALVSFKGIKGRMQAIDEGQDFKVFVDFAHTPNALENVLQALRTAKLPQARLIAVFGCAGLRDRTKRPLMGKIVCRLADVTILTAEDPRTENVNEIIDQIAVGCRRGGGKENKTYFCVPDRAEAIMFAVKMARKGDIVVVCGKGHEQSMCFGKTEYPWSDEKEVRQVLWEIKKNAKKN